MNNLTLKKHDFNLFEEDLKYVSRYVSLCSHKFMQIVWLFETARDFRFSAELYFSIQNCFLNQKNEFIVDFFAIFCSVYWEGQLRELWSAEAVKFISLTKLFLGHLFRKIFYDEWNLLVFLLIFYLTYLRAALLSPGSQ